MWLQYIRFTHTGLFSFRYGIELKMAAVYDYKLVGGAGVNWLIYCLQVLHAGIKPIKFNLVAEVKEDECAIVFIEEISKDGPLPHTPC